MAKTKTPKSKKSSNAAGRHRLIAHRHHVEAQIAAAKLKARVTIALDGALTARLDAESAEAAEAALSKAVDGFKVKRKTVFDADAKRAAVSFTAAKPDPKAEAAAS